MAARSISLQAFGRVIAAAVLAAALAGCAGAPPVPARDAAFSLPRQLHVVQAAAGQPPLDALLVVQREGTALRWSLFDPMGVPQARQMFERGQWRNDGFLRPNGQARNLFAALIFAWTPETELDANYGAGHWRSVSQDGAAQRELLEHGRPRWTVRWPQAAQVDVFTVVDTDGTTWRISPLKEQQ